MTTEKLAPVFLDNQPVSLVEAKPKLSAILVASGKTNITDVKWLQFQPVQPGTQGKSVRAEEILDRTSNPQVPIYLTSGTHSGAAAGTPSKSAMPIKGAAASSGTAKSAMTGDDEYAQGGAEGAEEDAQ